jgi:hypothetical protein
MSGDPISRTGVGLTDKATRAIDISRLFGAGGHQDGATALIKTNENIRIEEDLAISGMGERVIDENIVPNNVANVNTEFNFSSFKTGAATPRDGVVIDRSYARIMDGLSSGDANVQTGPGSNNFQLTLEALQSSFGQHYNGDAGRGPSTGARNPFSNAPQRTDPFSTSSSRRDTVEFHGMSDPRSENEMQPSVDFFLSTPKNINVYDKSDNYNEKSGLRRRNTKTSQSRQLERVNQRDDIMKAVEASSDLHASVMSEHFNSSFKSTDDRQNIYNRIHNPLNKYTASQVGISDISADSFRDRASRSGKSGNDKFKNTLVGI